MDLLIHLFFRLYLVTVRRKDRTRWEDPLRMYPGLNCHKRICADNKVKFILRIHFLKIFHRLIRAGYFLSQCLIRLQHKLWERCNCKTGHLHPVLSSRFYCLTLFMRRISIWHKPDLIQRKCLICSMSQHQMSVVDRIEGSSHNPYLHSNLLPVFILAVRSSYVYLCLLYIIRSSYRLPELPVNVYVLQSLLQAHADHLHSS